MSGLSWGREVRGGKGMSDIEVETIEYILPAPKECVMCGSTDSLLRIGGAYICSPCFRSD